MKQLSAVFGGRWGGALALVAAVAGVAILVAALLSQRGPAPAPGGAVGALGSGGSAASSPASPGTPDPGDSGSTAGSAPAPDREQGASRNRDASGRDETQSAAAPGPPTRVTIPAIDVRSSVFGVGKNPDGSLEVPQPGPRLNKVGWYRNSPVPGRTGPSVLEGHVSTEQQGPSVFYRLGELSPGDRIRVDRRGGSSVTFRVQALRSYDKDRFPTRLVYGGDISRPTLRLITCTDFVEGKGHTGNLVVFASPVSQQG